jgi:DNA-directed RNA polymerase specialized sigma24 family protein
MKTLNGSLPRPDRGADASRDLAAAMEALPLIERAALFFRDIRQLPLDEVAGRLGCSARVARIHIAQGRVKLLKQLETR